jgi:hypothetical protein
MSTDKEKLSILSEMIAFAKVENKVNQAEYDFLWSVSQELAISKDVFEGLFEKESEHVIPRTQAERILQFHRLVLLMNVDQVRQEVEVRRLHDIGLSMGLPPSAIDQVLTIMHQYPNNVIPPELVIDIFRSHYN